MDISALTMLVFGVLVTAMGMTGLVTPHILLDILGLPAAGSSAYVTQVFVMATSQASIAMGLYYILSATNNNRIFFQWSVPLRIINFIVFSSMIPLGIAPVKWLMVAALELAGALATGIAMASSREITFSRFNILRIVSVILASVGAIVSFSHFGIYGSASVFLAIFSAGFIYSYRMDSSVQA